MRVVDGFCRLLQTCILRECEKPVIVRAADVTKFDLKRGHDQRYRKFHNVIQAVLAASEAEIEAVVEQLVSEHKSGHQHPGQDALDAHRSAFRGAHFLAIS